MSHRPTTSRRRGPDVGRSAVLVVVIVACVALVAAAGWGLTRDGEPADAAVIARGLSVILDDVEYESGVATLDECPVLETSVLLTAVGSATEVDSAVIDGERSSVAYQETSSFPAGVFCNAFAAADAPLTSGAIAVSLSVTMTPLGAYEDFLLGTFDNESTELGSVVEFRNGEVHPYCLSAADEEGQTGCGADWVHDEAQVAVGVYLAGERDESAAVAALEATLPEVVEALDTGD
jgi:hypothetical protein